MSLLRFHGQAVSPYPASVLYMLATYGVDLRPVWDIQFASYPAQPTTKKVGVDALPAGCSISGGNIIITTQDTVFDRWDLSGYFISPAGAFHTTVSDSKNIMTAGQNFILNPQDLNSLSWTFTGNLFDCTLMDVNTTSPFLLAGTSTDITFMNNKFVGAPNDYVQNFSGGHMVFKRNFVRAWANNGDIHSHTEALFLGGRPGITSAAVIADENFYDGSNWIPGSGLTAPDFVRPILGVSMPGCSFNRNIYFGMGTPGMGFVFMVSAGTQDSTDNIGLDVNNNIVEIDPAIFNAMASTNGDPAVTLTGGQNISFADNSPLNL